MGDNTKKIEAYTDVLRVRGKFKRVQQLSWNINKMEQAYDIETATPEELDILFNTYINLVPEIKSIYEDLKEEKAKK
jgi:hypothetical protein